MNPYSTIAKGQRVGICRNVKSNNSTIADVHVGSIYTITGVDYSGRRHNRYVSCVYLRNTKGDERRATIAELATLNPNFEPEAEFIVCVGCGATISENDLRIKAKLRNIRACPSCGMLEPTES